MPSVVEQLLSMLSTSGLHSMEHRRHTCRGFVAGGIKFKRHMVCETAASSCNLSDAYLLSVVNAEWDPFATVSSGGGVSSSLDGQF